MTRIVSGFAGSLSLKVPRSGTRPTSDRTREGIFSALESRDAIEGARVLDLYAGSGALGLEAVSRGAASGVLVERAPDAAAVCRANAALIRKAAPGGADVRIEVAARSVLSHLEQAAGPFDLVFIDPPYDIAEDEVTRVLAALVDLLAPEADVVLERSTRSPEPAWPAGLSPVRRREYGETLVHYAVRD